MSKIDYNTFSIQDLHDTVVAIADILVEKTKNDPANVYYKNVRRNIETDEEREKREEWLEARRVCWRQDF
jgi:NADPH-dependent 7-cyano-7-deazaguanine reductase QueF